MTKLLVLVLLAIISLGGCTNKNEDNSKSQNQTESVSSADSNSVVYTNKQYGFQFSLPASWRGYTIHKTNWQGYVPDENSANDKKETGPIISIRDPRWTEQTPRQDIPIMVLTEAQWTSIQEEKLFIGAAPFGPSLLGQNEKYVFALPARYNFSYPAGYEEVDQILQNDPLKAFN
ncbi:PsbP-related protein [Paenibacillus albus]|uniref:Uncharacterized protein n=1 Tax=Paenibacillus albus TaxID=2495582 RepID=A0A3Q8X845_9BACL|nr:PsbP-related protein [Paenibacillus albus]AZN42635.1 hypothetical protein EJC50_25295 [Paenibacillus albus]